MSLSASSTCWFCNCSNRPVSDVASARTSVPRTSGTREFDIPHLTLLRNRTRLGATGPGAQQPFVVAVAEFSALSTVAITIRAAHCAAPLLATRGEGNTRNEGEHRQAIQDPIAPSHVSLQIENAIRLVSSAGTV